MILRQFIPTCAYVYIPKRRKTKEPTKSNYHFLAATHACDATKQGDMLESIVHVKFLCVSSLCATTHNLIKFRLYTKVYWHSYLDSYYFHFSFLGRGNKLLIWASSLRIEVGLRNSFPKMWIINKILKYEWQFLKPIACFMFHI